MRFAGGRCPLRVFVVGIFKLHPPISAVAAGVVPTPPQDDPVHYFFIAVSILGALISPYLFYFYSSGAVEEGWNDRDLGVNRAVAALGMGFGSVVSLGVLIAAAMVLKPRGIQVDSYEQASLMLTQSFGYWGFVLFVASLGVTYFGAALQITLNTGYVVSQTFGWNWGASLHPKDAARFSTVCTVFLFLSSLVILIGIDPLQLTLFSMALTAVMLPDRAEHSYVIWLSQN